MTPAKILSLIEVPYRFGEFVDLRNITCAERLVLDGRKVTGVDFSGASFPKGISARGTVFSGLSWFRDITASDADVRGATFHSDARFDGARIAGGIDAARAEFRGVAQFDHSDMGEGVNLTQATGYGNCSFEGTRLRGVTRFPGSEWLGGMWLESAAFEDLETGDMLVHGRLWTRRARVGNGAVSPGHFDISFGYSYT